MALNFPSNPSENDIYQFGLLTYIFKNGKWVSQSRGASQLPWYSNMEQARALWKRLAAEAGLNLVDGSFEEGAEITSSSDVVWWQAGSAIYGWHLNEAKTVPAGSTPETTGGIGAGAWVDRTDIILRERLAATTGAGLVGTTGGGTVQAKLDAIDAVSSILSFANDIGIANAYVCNFTPAITTRSEGQVLRFKVANTNTDASTLNDGIGVVPLVGLAQSALQGGELAAGGDAWVQWNSSVGTGSYVLLFCTRGSLQIPDAGKSHQALALGQILASVSASGYLKIPCIDTDGSKKTLIFQWASAIDSTATVSYTWPITFPNACLFAGPMSLEEATGGYYFGQVVAKSATGCTLAKYGNNIPSAPIAASTSITSTVFSLGY